VYFHNGNVENKWPTFQDGTGNAAFPAFALAAEASFGAQAAGAAPGLRSRSYFGGVGSAQAGRHLAVLTYWKYARGAKIAAALLNDFFDHSRRALDIEFFSYIYRLFPRNIQQAHNHWLEENR